MMTKKIVLLGFLLWWHLPVPGYANTDSSDGESPEPIMHRSLNVVNRLEYGLQSGANITTHGGKDAENSVIRAVNALRFVMGGFVKVRIFPWFHLQPELLLTMKGTDFEVDGMAGPAMRTSFIELPLLAHVKAPWWGSLSELRIQPYAFGGPTLSFLLSARFISTNGQSGDAKDDFKPIDFGLTFGAGVAVEPVWWGAVELSARYDLGLQQLGDTGERDDFKNRTISVMLGFRCCAHKPRAKPASEPEPVNDAPPEPTTTEGKPGVDPAPNALPDNP